MQTVEWVVKYAMERGNGFPANDKGYYCETRCEDASD
jgi:hypothetical protein